MDKRKVLLLYGQDSLPFPTPAKICSTAVPYAPHTPSEAPQAPFSPPWFIMPIRLSIRPGGKGKLGEHGELVSRLFIYGDI
jgi:hypothetical protein